MTGLFDFPINGFAGVNFQRHELTLAQLRHAIAATREFWSTTAANGFSVEIEGRKSGSPICIDKKQPAIETKPDKFALPAYATHGRLAP